MNPILMAEPRGARRGKRHIGKIAGQTLVRHAEAGRDRAEDVARIRIVIAGLRRPDDVDRLSRRNIEDRAWLEEVDLRPRGRRLRIDGAERRRAPTRIAGDHGETRRDLLFHQGCILEIVEIPHPEEDRRKPGRPADLSRPRRAEYVNHALRRDADGIERAPHHRSRMLRKEPIGDAPADDVEFHALNDLRAAGARDRIGVFGRVEKIGVEDLELEREREPVLRSPNPPADEDLAGLDDAPHNELLEPVKIVAPVRITRGRLAPSAPHVPGAAVVGDRFRDDAPSDAIVGDRGDGALGVRIIANEVARNIPEPRE
ncbi:MAG TPA: hypothetical protein VFQ80_14520 [Thermomicrobiales bacterium]|nr:hypothetical protein [Thermomicrobiales bacterium]